MRGTECLAAFTQCRNEILGGSSGDDIKVRTGATLWLYNGSFNSTIGGNAASVGVYTSITGNLYFANVSSLASFTFPRLQYIGGGLELQSNDNMTLISLQALTVIGGDVEIQPSPASKLTAVLLPFLTFVRGTISLGQVSVGPAFAYLTILDMKSLRYIGGSVDLLNTLVLTALAFPSLLLVGGSIDISRNAAISIITFPRLTYIGGQAGGTVLAVTYNDALTQLSFPALLQIDTSAPTFFIIVICDNDPLLSVADNILNSGQGQKCVVQLPDMGLCGQTLC